ncbi:MAG TPA: hypothetical protein VJC09_01040 [Candidatus Saccharimonadales bacterium]|nr:hypothetical protein [Candidatus Saccharimonadales bacterium]
MPNARVVSQNLAPQPQPDNDPHKVSRRLKKTGAAVAVVGALFLGHGLFSSASNSEKIGTIAEDNSDMRDDLSTLEGSFFDEITGEATLSQVKEAQDAGVDVDKVAELREQYDANEEEGHTLEHYPDAFEILGSTLLLSGAGLVISGYAMDHGDRQLDRMNQQSAMIQAAAQQSLQGNIPYDYDSFGAFKELPPGDN